MRDSCTTTGPGIPGRLADAAALVNSELNSLLQHPALPAEAWHETLSAMSSSLGEMAFGHTTELAKNHIGESVEVLHRWKPAFRCLVQEVQDSYVTFLLLYIIYYM